MKRALRLIPAVLAVFSAYPALSQPAPQPTPAPIESLEVNFLPAVVPNPPDDLLAKIRRRGVLKAGVSDIMPWAMHDKNGKLVGFEVDVLERLAEDLGVKVEFVPVAHDQALADLTSSRFDLVFNRMSITPERALIVDFSQPVVVSVMELLANKNQMGARRTLADFNAPDVTIGVHKGTSTEELARRGLPKARLVEFDDDFERFEALRSGKITGAVALTPVSGVVSARYPEIAAPLAAPMAKRAQAFAVRPNDAAFLVYLNSWITYQDLEGWIASRVNYWFRDLSWTDEM